MTIKTSSKEILESDWITPNQAAYLLAPALGGIEAAQAVIVGRIRENKLRVRASIVNIDYNLTKRGRDLGRKVPSRYVQVEDRGPMILGGAIWSSRSGVKRLNENLSWSTSTFSFLEVFVDTVATNTVGGMRVLQSDVEALLPGTTTSKKSDRRSNSGNTRGEQWNVWVAELVAYAQDEGIHAHQTAYSVIREVSKRLPDDATPLNEKYVQPTVMAVLKRVGAISREK